VWERITTKLGTSYEIEPLREFTGIRGDRYLSARFRDSRGYWDEGDFALDQIVSREPMLELERKGPYPGRRGEADYCKPGGHFYDLDQVCKDCGHVKRRNKR
jgi:hypothetical protein